MLTIFFDGTLDHNWYDLLVNVVLPLSHNKQATLVHSMQLARQNLRASVNEHYYLVPAKR